MIKLSDYVFDFIAKKRIKHIFMLPGGGCMHLVDSLGRNKDLEYICCLHEQAVAIAAEAYGQHTNNTGIGLVTSGPGSTNTITGVTAAWIDSTPCIFISGQAKRSLHLDFNWERLKAAKDKYGSKFKVSDPGYLGAVVISSETEEFTIEDIIKEFEFELLDDYFDRCLDHRHAGNIEP
jgi:hypothetical protein